MNFQDTVTSMEPSKASGEISLVRNPNALDALGLAVSFLSMRAPFSKIPTGCFVPSLMGQIERSHYFFGFNGQVPVGYLGWGLGDKDIGNAFASASRDLYRTDMSSGPCVIIIYICSTVESFAKVAIDKLRECYPGQPYYGRRYVGDSYVPKCGVLVPKRERTRLRG